MSAENIKKLLESTPVESPPVRTSLADPLPEQYSLPKFPLDALGEILGNAAKRMAYHVQVPEGIAGQSVLAVAALIAQAHINVGLQNIIGNKPVSLYFLSIAESGDRKSSVDSLALAPVNDFETKRRQSLQEDIVRYETAIEAWKMRKDSIIKKSNQSKGEITEQKQKELEEKLFNLEATKPKSPRRPNIIFGEPTPEGIWKHYCQGDPSAGLFSDEGISFFGGHGMNDESKGRTIGMISHFWDGKPISRTRGADGESGILAGCRLSAHLMVQPIIATQTLADPILQGQGILARFLICNERSIAGTRLLANRDLTQGANNDPAIGKYWKRIAELLQLPIKINQESGELELTTMEIKGDALNVWAALHDRIEKQIAPGGLYSEIKPFASKAAENAARIASVLAYIERYEQPSVEHVERSEKLIMYYLESMAIRTKEALNDMDALLARDLFEWIKTNGGRLTSNDFKRLSPPSIRPAKKARKILSFLVESGNLRISEYNSRTSQPNVWEIDHA
jgi:hypothetical protein